MKATDAKLLGFLQKSPQFVADAVYQNAKENTPHAARMAHDQALGRVLQILLSIPNPRAGQAFMKKQRVSDFVS